MRRKNITIKKTSLEVFIFLDIIIEDSLIYDELISILVKKIKIAGTIRRLSKLNREGDGISVIKSVITQRSRPNLWGIRFGERRCIRDIMIFYGWIRACLLGTIWAWEGTPTPYKVYEYGEHLVIM